MFCSYLLQLRELINTFKMFIEDLDNVEDLRSLLADELKKCGIDLPNKERKEDGADVSFF